MKHEIKCSWFPALVSHFNIGLLLVTCSAAEDKACDLFAVRSYAEWVAIKKIVEFKPNDKAAVSRRRRTPSRGTGVGLWRKDKDQSAVRAPPIASAYLTPHQSLLDSSCRVKIDCAHSQLMCNSGNRGRGQNKQKNAQFYGRNSSN